MSANCTSRDVGVKAHRMDRLPYFVGEVLGNNKYHTTVVNIQRQIQRSIKHLFLPIFMPFGFDTVLPEGSLLAKCQRRR
jgi:hypothetical protein